MSIEKKLIGLAITLIFSCLDTSCTTSKIMPQYNGVTYDEPELAIAARQKDLNSLLEKIKPTTNPCGGILIFIIPTDSYIEKRVIVWPTFQLSMSDGQKEKLRKYTITTQIQAANLLRDAIVKRRIFDEVRTMVSDDPESVVSRGDTIISVGRLEPDGKPKWYLRGKRDSSGKKEPIEAFSPELPPIPRMVYFLDSIEKLAREQ